MKHIIFTIICSIIISTNGSVTIAQQVDVGNTLEPPASPTENMASPIPTNPTSSVETTHLAEVTGKQCVPDCRSGFLCHQGVCVSACNPPCAVGYHCTANAQCVPLAPLPPTASNPVPLQSIDKAAARNKRRQEKLALRKQYRKVPRISFATDGALGALKDGNVLEASFHMGFGFRKNIISQFGVIARANLIIGMWEDESISNIELDYSAETSTKVVGFDVELFPYVGPFSRLYWGPVVGLRGMYPHKTTINVDIDPYYGQDETIHFKDTLFVHYGFGAGVLLGPKESININGRIMSSFTQRMPVYVQVGIAYDLPIKGGE